MPAGHSAVYSVDIRGPIEAIQIVVFGVDVLHDICIDRVFNALQCRNLPLSVSVHRSNGIGKIGKYAVNGHDIAMQSEATDDAKADRTEVRLMAESLPTVHITDVNLDNRALQ